MKIPTSVFLMCKCGANIVGSRAKNMATNSVSTDLTDYDLIVPPEKWYCVSLLIPRDATLNKHGGLRFKDDHNNNIDIWPCSVEQHLRQCNKNGPEYVVDIINRLILCSSPLEVGT